MSQIEDGLKLQDLNRLGDDLDMMGLDINQLTNPQIRAMMELEPDFVKYNITPEQAMKAWENQKLVEFVEKFPDAQIDKMAHKIEVRIQKYVKGKRSGDPTGSQSGNIDPKLAVAMGIAGFGIAAGVRSNDFGEAIQTAALLAVVAGTGAGGIRLLTKLKVTALIDLRKPINFDHLFRNTISNTDSGKLSVFRFAEGIKQEIPDPLRRVAITRFLEGEDVKLSPKETEAATVTREFFDELIKFANKNGIDIAYLENYIPHMYAQGTKTVSEMVDLLSRGEKIAPGTSTKFALRRVIPTLV